MMGLAKNWTITSSNGQTKCFIEDLGGGIDLKMVAIPGGCFNMGTSGDAKVGSPSERPQHQVTISAFFMGIYPITQAQWKAIARSTPVSRNLPDNPAKFLGAEYPIENISWEEAIEFCLRLSIRTRRYYRLPTEAEWEYACRAGTSTPFHFGEMLTPELANYQSDDSKSKVTKSTRKGTNAVGSLKWTNKFGLYDMHGNVWELCQDHWHSNYKGALSNGEARVKRKESLFRVIRGGSWLEISANCRSSCRKQVEQSSRENHIGLRVVCSL